jgi:hypothetical protein
VGGVGGSGDGMARTIWRISFVRWKGEMPGNLVLRRRWPAVVGTARYGVVESFLRFYFFFPLFIYVYFPYFFWFLFWKFSKRSGNGGDPGEDGTGNGHEGSGESRDAAGNGIRERKQGGSGDRAAYDRVAITPKASSNHLHF